VAVGDVVNIVSYGEQNVDRLPWPMSPAVHKLYWCEGDFEAVAVVKGVLQTPPRKYLWASGLPGCKLWNDDPQAIDRRIHTRAWFLREQGGFLRPTFDGGTYKYIGLFPRWDESPYLPAGQRLGTLLLTPAANADTLEEYANYLWSAGDIACELLGKKECARQIRALMTLGNQVLEEQACHFLEAEVGVECRTK